MESGLRQAAYWAGVRQDIYISLALQRAPNIKPSARRFPFEEPLLSPANDCTWACRTVLHCAAVLDFAFGSHDHPHSLLLYQRLEGYNRQWRTSRPASFDPYFSQPANDQSFPDLRFHTDWHGMPSPSSFLSFFSVSLPCLSFCTHVGVSHLRHRSLQVRSS